MNLRKFIFTSLISVAFSALLTALPIGSWSIHLPYYECKAIAGNSTHIWTTTDNSLFRLNKSDYSTERITKIEGLSDLTIGTIGYNNSNGVLVVGYQNGNIDLIKGNVIYNLPDIKRSQIVADKSINEIYFIGSLAYLSTGFGIIVVDTDRNEIKDTYLIGPNGNYLAVYDIVSDGTTLFAATATGIYRAQLNNSFLANYTSWTQYTGIPVGIYNTVDVFKGKLIVNYSAFLMTNVSGADVQYAFDFTNSTWSQLSLVGLTIKRTEALNNTLWVAGAYGLIPLDSTLIYTGSWYTVGNNVNLFPSDLYPDTDGSVWYSDNIIGLVRMTAPYFGTVYRPNGPVSNSAALMDIVDGRLCVVPGGRDDAWNNIYNRAGISFYQNSTWEVMQRATAPALDSTDDINFCKIDPNDNTHVWLGSWGGGLLEVRNNAVVNVFDQYNTILDSKIEYPWCGIGGIDYDKDGNLWMINSHTTKCLKVMKTDNTWAEFDFQGMIVTGTAVGNMMITENGQKWMIIPRNGGMIVFDDNGTIDNTADDKKKKLGFSAGIGAIPGTDVLCMVEDLDNEVWIGTDEGIAVFYCAETILGTAGCDAQQILIQQGEYTQILMESQVVTSLAVDGANRKWIGTESGGVFLMSPDGTEEILHFTADNSPLLSDNVTGITIDGATGEVFFATGKGIVSYRSDALDGEENMGDVYAYPNPVRPEYSGPIAIRGLVKDADVKITDISGSVVYQTTSLGGQAIWDGRNFQGERAASGVYLVFITNEDGTEKKVTKILLMN